MGVGGPAGCLSGGGGAAPGAAGSPRGLLGRLAGVAGGWAGEGPGGGAAGGGLAGAARVPAAAAPADAPPLALQQRGGRRPHSICGRGARAAGGAPAGVRPVVPMGVPPAAAAGGPVAAARAGAAAPGAAAAELGAAGSASAGGVGGGGGVGGSGDGSGRGMAAMGAAAAAEGAAAGRQLRWRQDPGRANKHRGQAAAAGGGATSGGGAAAGGGGSLAGAGPGAEGQAQTADSGAGGSGLFFLLAGASQAPAVGAAQAPAAGAAQAPAAGAAQAPAAGAAGAQAAGGAQAALAAADADGQVPGLGPGAPVQAAPHQAHQAAWLRLWSAPAGNRAKVLGWRLAHACLPCGLYVAKPRQRFDGHLCCEEECREHTVGRRPRASLSHLFCECPLYTAARAWLAATWEAITGTARPPLGCPALLLGDQPSAWPGYPSSPGRQQLWTVLRLCFLHAVWCVHMDRDRTAHHAHAVVAHTVAALRHLMWAQFRMTALSDALLEPLPTRLLSAQLKADRLADFSAVWAWRRVRCEVELPPAGAAEEPRLRVFLSLAAPVPAPAAPAGPFLGQAGV
ncbi:hypothetical protein TSOC_006627 [Tetrabaena socialis]|uniref:Uncharacterized protein n=1 Tax=Tetrabaena socialis TaxID=47790 RepID=A0A2J8A368_9CHLO|nr:hypothetical protein TSOC_006627 [Tetrabaena socialis]|eukprot:PNH06960.1 hypothetical protein TSOC_006627 [Tetrabaena socialis]